MHYGKDAIKQEAFEIVANDCYTKHLIRRAWFLCPTPKLKNLFLKKIKIWNWLSRSLWNLNRTGWIQRLVCREKRSCCWRCRCWRCSRRTAQPSGQNGNCWRRCNYWKGDFAIIDFAGTVDGEASAAVKVKAILWKLVLTPLSLVWRSAGWPKKKAMLLM